MFGRFFFWRIRFQESGIDEGQMHSKEMGLGLRMALSELEYFMGIGRFWGL